MAQRSKRMDTVSSPLTLLRDLEPARRAINIAMRDVRVSSPSYAALTAVGEALAKLAAELGHPEFFSTPRH